MQADESYSPQRIRMTPGNSRLFFLSALCGVFALASCTTTGSGPVAITKVNPYHLQSTPGGIDTTGGSDPMLDFEHRRYLLGAIDDSEAEERYGNYFSIFWKTQSKAPATVRLDFRQGKTGNQIHSLEEFVSKPGRTNVTKFQIAGPDYRSKGKVTQWKASVIENGTVVAEYKSYLWQ